MVWLIAACLCTVLLPDMIMTFKPLSGGLSFAVGFAAICIGLLFFMRSVYIRFGKEPTGGEDKIDVLSYLLGFFPCLLPYLIILYGSYPAALVLGAIYMYSKGLFTGIMVILAAGLSLLLGIPFFCWMNRCRKAPINHPIQCFFKKFHFGILVSVLLLAVIFTVPLGIVFIRNIWAEPGILSRHLILMVGSFVMAGLLNAAMAMTEKMMEGAETIPAEQAQTAGKKYVSLLITMLLCGFLALSQNMPQLMKNEPALLEAELKGSLAAYGFYLSGLDISGAAEIANEATEQMDHALLNAETAVNEVGNDKKALRKAEKNLKKTQKVCDKYEVFRMDGQALGLWEKFKGNGGADKKMVEEALTLSEEYPDRLWVQYTAAAIGSSFTYDEAKHYDRTAKAIERFEKLYLQEKKPADAERISFEKQIANMLLTVYHEEEAVEILEKLENENTGIQDDVELYELLAQCYDRTDRLKEAYELAVSYCENHTDSPYLMYYAALTALKLEKREECIQYTSKLASYTADCEDEILNDCDTWLFGMLEFLTLNDSSSYTDFQHDIYRELTEENAVIDENPFFRNYLDAVYLAYRSDHKEEPEEAFDKMNAVLTENPRLASAWYLCGIIASNSKDAADKEEAIAYYQKAGELNDRIPAVWYAMAKEYDRLGEYEKGIEVCKKALSLLPEQDHGSDWYGINYHCSRLLHSLEKAVNK